MFRTAFFRPIARAYTVAAAAALSPQNTRSTARAHAGFMAAGLATAGLGASWAWSTRGALSNEKPGLAGVKGSNSERTFIAVKPDGVQRALVGEIISRFEKRGYKLVAIKSVVPSRALAEEHYGDLKSKPFFNGLVEYMTNGAAPVVAMVWEGKDVIRQGRLMIGATNPLESAPGTIRGANCVSVGRNIIHGSDSFESAETEIGLWFGEKGLIHWEQTMFKWLFEGN